MPHIDLPSGSIILWSGAIVDIPAGFVLCDGNNDTPDLRDRFVPGAGLTYAVDDTGGSDTHVHTGTTDGHLHHLPAGANFTAGGAIQSSTNIVADTFTTDGGNNVPPYYSLAYIMQT